jgi:predicted acylesterase/phospholipase RssA
VTQVVTGILIGAVVAAVGALVNYLLGVRRDRQRWDREDERQRDRWNREDQQRREEWDHEHDFRDYEERRSAYSEFMASTDRLFAGDHSEEAFQEYRQHDAVVRLIAPAEVEKAADKLGYIACGSTVGNAEYRGALQEFIKAAREDLGKPPPLWP